MTASPRPRMPVFRRTRDGKPGYFEHTPDDGRVGGLDANGMVVQAQPTVETPATGGGWAVAGALLKIALFIVIGVVAIIWSVWVLLGLAVLIAGLVGGRK